MLSHICEAKRFSHVQHHTISKIQRECHHISALLIILFPTKQSWYICYLYLEQNCPLLKTNLHLWISILDLIIIYPDVVLNSMNVMKWKARNTFQDWSKQRQFQNWIVICNCCQKSIKGHDKLCSFSYNAISAILFANRALQLYRIGKFKGVT